MNEAIVERLPILVSENDFQPRRGPPACECFHCDPVNHDQSAHLNKADAPF